MENSIKKHIKNESKTHLKWMKLGLQLELWQLNILTKRFGYFNQISPSSSKNGSGSGFIMWPPSVVLMNWWWLWDVVEILNKASNSTFELRYFVTHIVPKVKNELPCPNSKMCLSSKVGLPNRTKWATASHDPRPSSPRVYEYQLVNGSYGGLVAKTAAASVVQYW